jgi:hypothetical protein
VAANADEAKQNAKLMPDYRAKMMHVDGILEIDAVQGCRIKLDHEAELDGRSVMNGLSYDDLHPVDD